MTTWTAISKTDHLTKCWKPREGFAFTKEMQVVPITIPELSKLLSHYCIAFIKDEDGYQAVVLLGLGEQKNVYLNTENKWLAGYVPTNLRAYPFILGNTDDNKKILCISESHLLDDAQYKLFESNGDLAKEAAEMLEFLHQNELGNQANRNACKAIEEAGLINDWKLTVKTSDTAESFEIKGLFRIDEQKLNQLDPIEFTKLRDSGALLLAYAHLFSLTQIDQVSQRIEYSRKISSVSQTEDLEGLFNDGGSLNLDNLRFD